MKRRQFYSKYILLLLGMLLLNLSCSKEDRQALDLDASVYLLDYAIHDVKGTIDEQTGEIRLQLPFGTDLTALQAKLQLPQGAYSVPAAEEVLNFIGDVNYTVYNGNRYKKYTVKALLQPPVSVFRINGLHANIDHSQRSISVLLPDGTDLSALKIEATLGQDVQMSPAGTGTFDFRMPQRFTFTAGKKQLTYSVSAISNSINKTAFLGTAATREQLSNPDEKAAADWFFKQYPESDYLSFQQIASGLRLSNFKVIWWHYDATQDLPLAALDNAVVNALKAYRQQGGALLLTSYASRYVEALGVVPAGKGPNNVFADAQGFIAGDNWGISYRGHENHPIFRNLRTYESGKAYLLSAGAFRYNKTSWWFLPEWGGYGHGANWRQQTGGINLASEGWDDQLDGRVGLAEWPQNGQGNVVVVNFGAYDWYTEPLRGGQPNSYLDNIQRITKNAIDYLTN